MTVGIFRVSHKRVHLNELHTSSSNINRRGSGVQGDRYFMKWCVTYSGVVPAAVRWVQQRFPRGKQRLTGVVLGISQGLGEWLIARFRQQENADDTDESAAGKNDMMKEIALLVVEFHDGCSKHAKASTGQNQAQTTTPDHSGSDLGTEEDAQVADCMGGEHTNDGEGDGEVLIHGTCGIYIQMVTVLPQQV